MWPGDMQIYKGSIRIYKVLGVYLEPQFGPMRLQSRILDLIIDYRPDWSVKEF